MEWWRLSKRTKIAMKILFSIVLPVLLGAGTYKMFQPGMVRFYLPDFLWAFAFSNAILVVWVRINLFWILILVVFFIAYETLQKMKIIAGTFDYFDILLYFSALLISIILHEKEHFIVFCRGNFRRISHRK